MSKEEAIEQGRETLANLRHLLGLFEKSLNSTEDNVIGGALLSLRALEIFIHEEKGLQKIGQEIARKIEKLSQSKNIH